MTIKDLTIENIKAIDKSDMFSVLKDFPNQVEHAIQIGQSVSALPESVVRNIYLLGMGGSAIGGDLLSSYFSKTPGLNHFVVATNRDYNIPGSLNNESAVIASSYSGGTEETIEGLNSAFAKTKNIVCITTGGKIAELADKYKLPKVIIPKGFMPRCALGYSFFPILSLLTKSINLPLETMDKVKNDVESTLAMLKQKSELYSKPDSDNPALLIAGQIHSKIPVIYSSNSLSSVNLRWRCQIQENAKHLCWGHVLPEMNHNEINSWTNPVNMTNNFVIITLEDPSDHPKVNIRFNAIRKLLTDNASDIISLKGEEDNFLTRMFSLIYLGDWVSYYLALLNGEDPTPIPLISKLKDILAEGA